LRDARLGVVRKYAGFNMHVDRVFYRGSRGAEACWS
jgi:hypothetical protein